MPNNNIWQWYLEDYPETLYQASVPKGTPSFQDYWQKQMSKVMGEYQGALGKQAMSGQPPSLFFQDFLQNYPWTQNWFNLSPGQRGVNTGRMAPSLQWRF